MRVTRADLQRVWRELEVNHELIRDTPGARKKAEQVKKAVARSISKLKGALSEGDSLTFEYKGKDVNV